MTKAADGLMYDAMLIRHAGIVESHVLICVLIDALATCLAVVAMEPISMMTL
jgi:hypothetical protein